MSLSVNYNRGDKVGRYHQIILLLLLLPQIIVMMSGDGNRTEWRTNQRVVGRATSNQPSA